MQRLSPSDFSPAQVADWIEASKAVERAAPDPAESDAAVAEADTWFVAYTNPRREGAVEGTIRRRRFRSYVPVMTVTWRRRDVLRPLFPRYVFVGLRPGLTLYGLRDTPGLESLVRMAGTPVTVPGDVVSGLRDYQSAGVFDFTDARMAAAAAAARAKAALAFEPGRPVRVVDGPYRSFRGVVVRLLPEERVSVSLTLFARTFDVPLPLAHVEKAW
ncbi:transcription termination/antitermination protein NusG [Methylobacterium sp. D54C]